jgi:acetyl esterase/lipase
MSDSTIALQTVVIIANLMNIDSFLIRISHYTNSLDMIALINRATYKLLCSHIHLFLDNKEKKKLPVLVLVHGDEYGWNSANAYNATTLAAYGQIIVVTINYRLGVFGNILYIDHYIRLLE